MRTQRARIYGCIGVPLLLVGVQAHITYHYEAPPPDREMFSDELSSRGGTLLAAAALVVPCTLVQLQITEVYYYVLVTSNLIVL